MAELDRARRRFLGTTALAGIGVLLGTRAARAFSQAKMDPATHQAYLNGCTNSADPYHAGLVQAAQAEMQGRMSDAEIQSAIAAMRCPICGCALVSG